MGAQTDDQGGLVNEVPDGSYLLPVQVRQTATTAANATVFAMRNTSSAKTCFIKKIHLVAAFDGTAAASTSRYELCRFSAATPTAGTAITVIKKKSSYSASNVTDARFVDTGLTTTSVTFEMAFAFVAAQRQVSATSVYTIDFNMGGDEAYDDFTLAPGEGLCIRLGVTAVIGDSITGYVEWDER